MRRRAGMGLLSRLGFARKGAGPAPLPVIEKQESRRALDELFELSSQYRATVDYMNLLQFVARFRFYAPYNAMLVNIQMPGARYVATPSRWMEKYQQRIRSGPSAGDPQAQRASDVRLRCRGNRPLTRRSRITERGAIAF